MDPIDTLMLMAASLRAGKAGSEAQAWAKAVEEAVYGMSVILHNEASIRDQLRAALPPPPEPTLVQPAGGLVVPV